MPNLYGVAGPNPLPVLAQTIGAADVVCNAGAETNFCAISVPPAVSPGIYYPVVWGSVVYSLGASTPTSVNWAARIGAGSDFQVFADNFGLFAANGNYRLYLSLYGYTTFLTNPYGATTFNVTCAPITNGLTARTLGTAFYGMWMRAADQ